MPSEKNTGTVKKVFLRIKKYMPLMIISVILAAGYSVLSLYIPILAGNGIDLIVRTGDVDIGGLIPILAGIAETALLAALCQWIMNIINNRVAYNVVKDLREDAFAKIQSLPLKYLDVSPVGELVNRVIADAEQFADGLLLGFTQLFTGIVTIVGTLIFMLTINVKIALIVFVLTPLSLFASKFIAEHTYSMFKTQSETRAEQTAFTDEMLGNLKIVQAFSHSEAAQGEYDEINNRLEKCSLRATFYSSTSNPVTRFINNLIYAAVGAAGAFVILSGNAAGFTVGKLTSFLSYANQYTKPFNEISSVITELQNALACAARIFALIEEEPQIPDAENAIILENPKGDIEFKDLRFSYLPDVSLIENFNQTVKSGEHVAIVGPTGCGKTTLINLIMRFYDVNSGGISVDGTDIRNITRKSLRQNIGMVLQETWLKSGTIRENITMGKPDASEDEIIRAAKAAHSHSFIRRLENGYDTVIGEDGGNLSQGQKQLLCITRLMLAKPPMLILDEATSSIDTRTEMKIQNAFNKLMEGRTSFIVAHRLSTIREADIILVMNKGNIIEKGNHEELLAKKGFYFDLYNSQFAVSGDSFDI